MGQKTRDDRPAPADSEEHVGWVDDWTGHGRTYQYRSAFGRHLHEVFWDVDLYEAPEDKKDHAVPNRPQKIPTSGGSAVRYLDHVTMPSANMGGDIEFYKKLGARHTAATEVEPGFSVFSTLTCNGIRSTHDIALVPDFSGMTGRGHHIAFRVDQRVDVERMAEIAVYTAPRSSSVPVCTASMRSPTSTFGSRRLPDGGQLGWLVQQHADWGPRPTRQPAATPASRSIAMSRCLIVLRSWPAAPKEARRRSRPQSTTTLSVTSSTRASRRLILLKVQCEIDEDLEKGDRNGCGEEGGDRRLWRRRNGGGDTAGQARCRCACFREEA